MLTWGGSNRKKRRKKRRHKKAHHHKHHHRHHKKKHKKPTTPTGTTPATPIGPPPDNPTFVPPPGGSLPEASGGGDGGGGGGSAPPEQQPGGQPPPSGPVPYPAPNVSVYSGPFGAAQATRLLWRAGFGPGHGGAAALAAMNVTDAVTSLTRPGVEQLIGPEPKVDGGPLAPDDAYGHDHLDWLDRMARSNQPLVQRMALIWHDWFATSNDKVDDQKRMRDQIQLFRAEGLDSFRQLLYDVTHDPAMLIWLDGIYNDKDAPNENYGREVMELFTLGADRGAYTEDDVREMARAFTGWVADYDNSQGGWINFHFDRDRHDRDPKTIFGHTDNYDWQGACALLLDHPLHASFFVRKLWSYFHPAPPSPGTQADLEALYTSTDHQIRPVLEAILMHPDLYQGPSLVKPPTVLAAGLLRILRLGITDDGWIYDCQDAGQRLFYPPNVSGWNDNRWLDTSTMRGRWEVVARSLENRAFDPWDDRHPYDPTETPEVAVESALNLWDHPPLSTPSQNALNRFAINAVAGSLADWQQSPFRAMRQNALRQLVAIAPDNQVS